MRVVNTQVEIIKEFKNHYVSNFKIAVVYVFSEAEHSHES